MCGIQAGFDGKSLLPLNFRSLSGASPLPPHPPFPLFLRPTSTLHQGQSPCTRALRAATAPPHPTGTRPHSAPQDSLLHLNWGPYTLFPVLPTFQHMANPVFQGCYRSLHALLRLPLAPQVGHLFPFGPSHQPLCGQACFSLQLSLQPLSGVRLHFPRTCNPITNCRVSLE